jgi:hypothetical protein
MLCVYGQIISDISKLKTFGEQELNKRVKPRFLSEKKNYPDDYEY